MKPAGIDHVKLQYSKVLDGLNSPPLEPANFVTYAMLMFPEGVIEIPCMCFMPANVFLPLKVVAISWNLLSAFPLG